MQSHKTYIIQVLSNKPNFTNTDSLQSELKLESKWDSFSNKIYAVRSSTKLNLANRTLE
jgi:hypothetical protein